MKILLIVTLVVAAVVIGGALLAGPKLMEGLGGLRPEPKRTEVRVEELEPRSLVESVSAPGVVEPHTKVDISALVSARIEALPFREGEEVEKSDVIVRLDDRDLKAALQAAEARRDGERFRLESERARETAPTLSTNGRWHITTSSQWRKAHDSYLKSSCSRRVLSQPNSSRVRSSNSMWPAVFELCPFSSSSMFSRMDSRRSSSGQLAYIAPNSLLDGSAHRPNW